MDKSGKSKLALVLLLLLCLLSLPIGALADAQESLPSLTNEPTLSVELGYSGTIAYLRTMPLTITVNGGSRDTLGTISVDINRDPERFDRYEYPVTIAARSTQRVTIPIKLSMRQPSFNVRLTSEGEVLAESSCKPTRELGSNIVLVGTLSPDASSLSYMNMSSKTDPNAIEELWTLISLNEHNFPSNIDILNAFNLLMVDGFDVRTLSEIQQTTLKTWIEQGGILILGGGAQASTAYPFFEPFTVIKATGLTEATDVPSALLRAVTKTNPSLEAAAATSATIPSPQLMLNTVSSEISPLIAGTHPLVYETPVTNGFILTATFELGAKPLSQWSLMHSMWVNVIRSDNDISRAYNNKISQIRNSGYGYDDYNNLANIATTHNIPIDRSAAPALVLLGAYLLLAGVISYLILKKLDKRELMWLTVPVLAVVFAFLVRALGAKLQFDQPLAVTVAQINYDQNGKSSIRMGSALSSSSMNPLTVSADPGYTFDQTNANSGYYYDYYDPQQNQKQPTKLNYRYLLGDEPGIVLPNVQSWTVYAFKFKQVPLTVGSITGRAWMEEDGLHAEVHNESGQRLTEGAVIGTIGFNRMADIASGETGTAFLKQSAQSQKGFLAAPTQNPKFQSALSAAMPAPTPAPGTSASVISSDIKDTSEEETSGEEDTSGEETASGEEKTSGEEETSEEETPPEEETEEIDPYLPSYGGYNYYGGSSLSTLPVDGEMRSGNPSGGYLEWDYLMAIANPEAVLDPEKGLTAKDGSYLRENFLSSIYQEVSSYRNESTSDDGIVPILNYVALADDMPAPNLYVDGQKITQTVNRSFVNVALSYEPIGPTGIVCYLPDMIQPRRVLTGFKADPTQTTDDELDPAYRNIYYELNKQLDFVFDLNLDRDIDVELLEVSAFSNDSIPKMSLYNLETKSWDECLTLLQQLKSGNADKYFADGKLYLRITPNSDAVTIRDYIGSIPAPSLALKGRVK